jgi:hypothetical protein
MSNTSVVRTWQVTAALSAIGVVAGAIAAVVLTKLGNVIAGAPHPPPIVVYTWNVGAFAVMGAVFSPVIAWSMLRRAPLWRAVVEPALGGVVGTVIGMLFAPAYFPVIILLSTLGASWRLSHAFRPRESRPAIGGG